MNTKFSDVSVKLLGSGSALPGPLVENKALLDKLRSYCGEQPARLAEKYADRLGIRSRHLSRSLDQPLSGTLPERDAPHLCRNALETALNEASLGPDNLTYLIGHTATPHTLLPPNIAWVAEGMRYQGPYVELRHQSEQDESGDHHSPPDDSSMGARRIAQSPLLKSAKKIVPL